MPAILKTLWQLTGEQFTGPGQVRAFLKVNGSKIAEVQAALDALEKEQKRDAR